MPIPIGACEVWFMYQLTGDNEPMFTHLAYLLEEPPVQAAVDAGFAEWQTSFRALAASQYQLVGGHILTGNDGGSIRYDSSITPLAGTAASASIPQNTAYLAKKSSASGGRRNRGRMYIPGLAAGGVGTAGVVPPATITTVNTALARLMPGGSVHTAFGFLGSPVILHQSGSQTPTVITDLSCSNLVATQRRRLRR
jgi:hypothetical protein